jgi:hypothetical protein
MIRHVAVPVFRLIYWSTLATGLTFMGYAVIYGWNDMVEWLFDNAAFP